MPLVANARMYGVAPGIAAAWRALFEHVSRTTGIGLDIIDHAFPTPLDALWQRDDLGAAFICGFPYMREFRHLKPVAAPLLAAKRHGGRPVYMSDLVVRAESTFETLQDTFGHRLGYTAEGSHSGFNALRHHLLGYRSAERPRLFSQTLGPFVTPRRMLEAVIDGTVDIGPIDGYALDLMRRADPSLDDEIRVVATTASAPIPFLAASASTPDALVSRLRGGFIALNDDASAKPLLDALLLSGFADVDIAGYDVILDRDREARDAGYAMPV